MSKTAVTKEQLQHALAQVLDQADTRETPAPQQQSITIHLSITIEIAGTKIKTTPVVSVSS